MEDMKDFLTKDIFRTRAIMADMNEAIRSLSESVSSSASSLLQLLYEEKAIEPGVQIYGAEVAHPPSRSTFLSTYCSFTVLLDSGVLVTTTELDARPDRVEKLQSLSVGDRVAIKGTFTYFPDPEVWKYQGKLYPLLRLPHGTLILEDQSE